MFFCCVAVILLHCGSFCHENEFLECVNIPANKAHSDSGFVVQGHMWILVLKRDSQIGDYKISLIQISSQSTMGSNLI